MSSLCFSSEQPLAVLYSFSGKGELLREDHNVRTKYPQRKIERDPRLALARVPTPILPHVVGQRGGEKSLSAL
jgi:hypothetical protein